jgi:hypothetical protein
MPKAYVDVFLRRLELKDPALERDHYTWPLYLAGRPDIAARAEPILARRSLLDLTKTSGLEHEGAMLLARVALQRTSDAYFETVVQRASRESPKASAFLLREAMRLGLRAVPSKVLSGAMSRHGHRNDALALHLGAEADVLRREALEGCYGEHAAVCDAVANLLGLHAEHFDTLLAVIRRHPGKGLPAPALTADVLKRFGPARAAKLATDAKGEKQFEALLAVPFPTKDIGPVLALWKAVIPHVGPDALDAMAAAAKAHHEAATLVGMRLLEAEGEEWGWYIHGKGQRYSKSARAVWSLKEVQQAMQADPLRSALLGAVLDPRNAVSNSALVAAHRTPGQKGLDALVRARQSPWKYTRDRAYHYLGERGHEGSKRIVEAVDWKSLDARAAYAPLRSLAKTGDKKQAGIVAEFLKHRTDDWAYVWHCYAQLDPKGAGELALKEAMGDGGAEFRYEALHVLTRTHDERRIPILAAVLEGTDREAIVLVLEATAEQYLVELGEGVLKHLRNPDEDIREHAMEAVEKLKFYADAKKAIIGKD